MRARVGTRKASREGVEFARGRRREVGELYGEGRPLLLREDEGLGIEEDGDGRVET